LQETLGWSERWLASEIGTSNASLSYIKSGKRSLNRRSRTLIEAFLKKYPEKLERLVNFSTPKFATHSVKEKKGLTLQTHIQNFLLAKQVEGKSEATLTFYRENLGRFDCD